MNLFKNYRKNHSQFLETSEEEKQHWFNRHVQTHYLPKMDGLCLGSPILEIGCGPGYLLKSLNDLGFYNLTGIDYCQEEILTAQKRIKKAELRCDEFPLLENNFDLVILKDVIEHQPKRDIFRFLDKVKWVLNPGGMVMIETPNMDWMFAGHERYMDFTHDIGFTRESLGQVMREYFDHVEVTPIDRFKPKLKMRVARFILGKLLLWGDQEGGAGPIWCRELMGTGRKS